MANRRAVVRRDTTETQIQIDLGLDGTGRSDVKTPVPFLTHMLELFARHGFFDLQITAAGDTHIDDHHSVEDIGIVLGQAVAQAVGDKAGIRRFGSARVPMQEALATVDLDLCGRAYLVYNVDLPKVKVGGFDVELAEDFLLAFANHAHSTVHVNLLYGKNMHHCLEGVFKAFGRALDQATQLDPRVEGVLSTKGVL